MGSWRRWMSDGLIVLAVISLICVAAAGLMYRLEWLALRPAMAVLGFGAVAALVISAIGIILLVASMRWPQARLRCLIALIIAAPALLVPGYLKRTADQVPPIHDIATDTRNPPVVHNAQGQVVAYPGEEVARQQREAYPNVEALVVDAPQSEVFDRAREVATGLGWEIKRTDPEAGRIEAVATTLWWGFKDDVAIRITDVEAGTRVDIRSVSRVGVSDLGKNAERIRTFMRRLGNTSVFP